MIERVTFGRNISFIAEVVIVSIPLIFTAASGSPPQYFVSLSTHSLLLLSMVGLAGSCSFAYLILRKVGLSTYSPNLHSKLYILSSTALLLLLGIIATYIGYLLLVYPYTHTVVPKPNDILVGLFLSSLYLIGLSGAIALAVWSRSRKEEKQELVAEFLTATSELKNADLDDVSELANTIESAGNQIVNKANKEPMQDVNGLSQDLRTWLDEFEGASGSDKKRMVGWTVGDTNERGEPWAGYYSTFVEFRKELSKLDNSSEDRLRHGS